VPDAGADEVERRRKQMSETTGPVELLAVSFGERARFEGRIAEEIEKLEDAGLVRVVDFLFLKRERDSGALVRVDYDGDEGLVARVLDTDDVGGGPSGHHLRAEDIRAIAAAIEPGASVAFIAFEHLWSRGLHESIAEVGGEPFVDGFVTNDALVHTG
jgi:hypothetical protein